MTLVYKPSPESMIPNNETINVTKPIDFTLKFQGYICKSVTYQWFKQGNSGMWEIFATNNFITQDFPDGKYNGDIIKIQTPANYFLNVVGGEAGIALNKTVGYRTKLLGETKNGVKPTATTDPVSGYVKIINHGYSSGDSIWSNYVAETGGNITQIYASVIDNNTVKFYPDREGSLQDASTPISGSLLWGKVFAPVGVSQTIPFMCIYPSLFALQSKTLTAPTNTFIPTWSSTSEYQITPIINRFEAILYETEKDKMPLSNIVEDTGEIVSANIKYEFTHALLTGMTYGVRFICYDSNEFKYDTGVVSFPVLYDAPTVGFNPVAENICETSSINVKWSGVSNITGTTTGDYTYKDNFMEVGNTVLDLGINSTLSYAIDIPKNSPPIFTFSPDSNNFNGNIVRMEDTVSHDYANVSYSQAEKMFKSDINGVVRNINVTPLIPEEKIITSDLINLESPQGINTYSYIGINGFTSQYNGSINPSFGATGIIPIVNKKYQMPDGSYIELCSCGDNKDRLVDGVIYKQTKLINCAADPNIKWTVVNRPNGISLCSFIATDMGLMRKPVGTYIDMFCNMAYPSFRTESMGEPNTCYYEWTPDFGKINFVFKDSDVVATGRINPTNFRDKLTELNNAGTPLLIQIPIDDKLDKAYGVRYDINASSPIMERLGLAIGKVANVGVDAQVVVNDFNSVSPWKDMKVCNVINGKAVAFKGQTTFKTDGTNGDVMVQIPKHYYLCEQKVEDGITYMYKWVSMYPLENFKLSPRFKVDGIGNELPYFYYSAYEGSLTNNKIVSSHSSTDTFALRSKTVQSLRNSLNPNTFMLDIHADAIVKTLFEVEFATRDSQSIMSGVTGLAPNGIEIQPEFYKMNYFVVAPYTLQFPKGCGVGNIDKNGNYRFVGFVDHTESEPANATVYMDRNVDVLYTVFPLCFPIGKTDSVIASSGSVTGNYNYWFPMKYRGIENLYGNIDKFIDGINIVNNSIRICDQPSKYTSNISQDYRIMPYTLVNGDGYIKNVGFDANNPSIQEPINIVDASATTYYCDYSRASATSTNGVVYAGGNPSSHKEAGLYCRDMSKNSSTVSYYSGCRIVAESKDVV